ncbi:hypothetical protein F383_13742 [Gossypium arboreum]|uniref:Uncharacterized protein n=1 Tax=Gossypium arboreum TaxID=29729 RepID=A0A0B0N6N0_GOSAR|nr:hypothetical protein F383_13742 [Gossypium arboreum]
MSWAVWALYFFWARSS